MSLDRTKIEQIARLARLALGEDEIGLYQRELSNILGLVDTMNSVNTAAVAPLAHPLEITARLRPDEVTETNQRDKFQAIAPAVANGYYLVPRVIE